MGWGCARMSCQGWLVQLACMAMQSLALATIMRSIAHLASAQGCDRVWSEPKSLRLLPIGHLLLKPATCCSVLAGCARLKTLFLKSHSSLHGLRPCAGAAAFMMALCIATAYNHARSSATHSLQKHEPLVCAILACRYMPAVLGYELVP